MADNSTVNPGTGGDVFGADDIGGVKFQRIKLVHGADGANDGDVSSTNPLPIRWPAITTITHAVVSPSATSAVVLAANTARDYALIQNVGSVDVTLNLGAAAVAGAGIVLKANGGFYEIASMNLYRGVINGNFAATTTLIAEHGPFLLAGRPVNLRGKRIAWAQRGQFIYTGRAASLTSPVKITLDAESMMRLALDADLLMALVLNASDEMEVVGKPRE